MAILVDTDDLKLRLSVLAEARASLVTHARLGKATEGEIESFDRSALKLTAFRADRDFGAMRRLSGEMLMTYKEYT